MIKVFKYLIILICLTGHLNSTCSFCDGCSNCGYLRILNSTTEQNEPVSFLISNNWGSDLIGMWTANEGDAHCKGDDLVVSVQFIKSPYMPSTICVHWSLRFKVKCKNNIYYFTADFTQGGGLRRRFGSFANTYCTSDSIDIEYKNYNLRALNDTLYTPLKQSDYKFFSCNCHDYVNQIYSKIRPGHCFRSIEC